ncbi:hypothetical protein IAT40_005501 [Kwoniella sp. CBS 6097]
MSTYTLPSAPPPTPSYPSTTNTKMDPESLAMLIRQLKRSPESPSKLTLPPIMGVITERDENEDEDEAQEDEQESDVSVSVSIEEVDDYLSSPSDYEEEEDDEAQVDFHVDFGRAENVLWVIEEESEDMYEEHKSPEEVNPDLRIEDSFAPLDRCSSPPPSPSVHHLEPTFSSVNDEADSNPMYASHVNYQEEFSSMQDDHSLARSSLHAVQGGDDDRLEDPFRYINAENDPASPISESCSQSVLTEVPVVQRRRRRTLSELEQYRKWALNKAAYLTAMEVEAEEERKRIKAKEEQMEREGLWISWRREKKGWSTGGTITRAKSYPPFTRSSSILPAPTSETAWSSPAILPVETEDLQSTETIDPFLSTWYDEEDQIEHLEYAFPTSALNHPESTYGCPAEDQSPPGDEWLSPPSPKIDTPRQSKRSLFPSVDDALCQNGMFREGVGLGLGLSGMDGSSGGVIYDEDEGYSSSQVGGEALEDALEKEEGAFVLREIPIKMIFPTRREAFDDRLSYRSENDSLATGYCLLAENGTRLSSERLDVTPNRGRSRARSPIDASSPSCSEIMSSQHTTTTLGLSTSPDSQRYRSSRRTKGLQRSRSESIPSHRSLPDLCALNDIQDEAEVDADLGGYDYRYHDETSRSASFALPHDEDATPPFEAMNKAINLVANANDEDPVDVIAFSTRLNRRHTLSDRIPYKIHMESQYHTIARQHSLPEIGKHDLDDCTKPCVAFQPDEEGRQVEYPTRSRSRSAPPI